MSRTPMWAAVIAALLGVSYPALSAADPSSEIAARKALSNMVVASARVGESARAVEIVVLFRSDCPPCRHELDILPGIAAHYPDLAVTLLVLLDDGLLAKKSEALNVSNLHIRSAEGAERETMARYGDDRRALPFSAALDAKGQVCGRHYGLLGLDMVGQWREAC